MILKLEQRVSQKDIEITITYPQKNRVIERLVSIIKSVDMQIECYLDDSVKNINVSDIYYIESLDEKTIVCCEKEKYITKYRLYQIYEKLKSKGFIQISKYCIINVNKLDKFRPMSNSRLEAVLSNKIYLCVTRKYVAGIKQFLRESE
ncbi:MAG: LytTR family transcriptional regulator DNA-binding domain-containing protein [Treponema sp.]|nr:LytTR family transcriptional regulator DNA-binding domain-containing protein [Treponema sp.]